MSYRVIAKGGRYQVQRGQGQDWTPLCWCDRADDAKHIMRALVRGVTK